MKCEYRFRSSFGSLVSTTKNAANNEKGRPSATVTCALTYHHSTRADSCGRSWTARSIGPGSGQSCGHNRTLETDCVLIDSLADGRAGRRRYRCGAPGCRPDATARESDSDKCRAPREPRATLLLSTRGSSRAGCG